MNTSRRYKFYTWTAHLTPAELLALKGNIEDYRMLPSHYSEFKHLAYCIYEAEMEISGIVRFRKQVLPSTMKRIFGVDSRFQGANRQSYKSRIEDYTGSTSSTMKFELGDEKTLRRYHEHTPNWVKQEDKWKEEIERIKRRSVILSRDEK